MKVLTCTSYKEHWELYTEIHGSIAVNDCQIGLFKKDKILLKDIILMKYSKSSGIFGRDDYIQFTLSSATLSMILTQKLKQEFYDKNKTGTRLRTKT